MYIGSLREVTSLQESNFIGHASQVSNTVDRFSNAARNKNRDDDTNAEMKQYLKDRKWATGNLIDKSLKSSGYRGGVNTKDKSPGYYAIKGISKAIVRPMVHIGDHVSKAYDTVGDAIKSTKIGKKINDTIDDYYHDDRGKHPFVQAVGSGLSSFAIGRANARYAGVGDNKYYKGADAAIGALDAANSYYYSKKRAKRTEEQVRRIQKNRADLEKLKRKDRDERMKNFWRDMKS